ncbi:MAG TPA: hypothetical protein DCE27_07330 [Xanthomarina gelatinilytica]|nr:hypothetical protein [Xanthomarina gelatinilytica]
MEIITYENGLTVVAIGNLHYPVKSKRAGQAMIRRIEKENKFKKIYNAAYAEWERVCGKGTGITQEQIFGTHGLVPSQKQNYGVFWKLA